MNTNNKNYREGIERQSKEDNVYAMMYVLHGDFVVLSTLFHVIEIIPAKQTMVSFFLLSSIFILEDAKHKHTETEEKERER